MKEDPDIFVELIGRIFYQLSYDDVMVAIIADYPGLLPASQVNETRVPTFEKDFLSCTSPTVYKRCFIGKALGTPCRAHGYSPTRGFKAGQAKKEGGPDGDTGTEV